MTTTLQLVGAFHAAFSRPIPSQISVDDPTVNKLRIDLLQEELDELQAALAEGNPIAALDALTDLQYVLDGAYLDLGLWPFKELAFIEVQRSNMSKLGEDGKPMIRPDGKILKGPNYSPPDLLSIIENQD